MCIRDRATSSRLYTLGGPRSSPRVDNNYITPHTHTGELRRVMNDAVTEELNGFKINIEQEGVGLDQIQAFKNTDRANALDYSYDAIPSYDRTKGYNNRLKRHNKWLLKANN